MRPGILRAHYYLVGVYRADQLQIGAGPHR